MRVTINSDKCDKCDISCFESINISSPVFDQRQQWHNFVSYPLKTNVFHVRKPWYTVSGIAMSVTILYWARSHGERGGGGGDSSDNIQIDSYHMAATGTVSSSSSSDKRKASGDDQQRRATVGVDRNSGQQCFKIDS